MKSLKLNVLTVLLLIAGVAVNNPVLGQLSKPTSNHDKEIIPESIRETKIIGSKRVETSTGIIIANYKPGFLAKAATPQLMAQEYLESNASYLTGRSESSDLTFKRTIETPGGFKVHFVQKANGYPVYNSTVTVSINRMNEVVFLTNSYSPVNNLVKTIKLSDEDALRTAKTYVGVQGKMAVENVSTIVYPVDFSKSVMAYLVSFAPAEDQFGDWEIIVDAADGTIRRAEDKACYHHQRDEVDGSGWVFDPDPITNTTKVYGVTGFKDDDDADSDSLTAQLKEVDLLNITFEDGLYKLKGPYASIVDYESPFTGTYEQDSSNFHFTRSNGAFEAVNIYYHVNHSMTWVNDSLGFDVMPFQYEGGVQFDPHGFNNAVNAHYVGSGGYIAFGSPPSAVDLGEDHAIVLHELGHGLHHWITDGSLSQVDGLSEGLSDYWAQSYTRSLGKFQPEDNGYDWFGVWGGMPSFPTPSLRNTDVTAHYPEDLTGAIHTDGQMWSSSLMKIYDQIGKTATDMNHWEAISMLNSQSGQVDAAMAFMQADQDIYDGEHIDVIYEAFFERGYITDIISIDFNADQTAGEGPLNVTFTDLSASFGGEISTWEWDLDGDGIVDSNEPNPSFTYDEIGAYTVSLKVSDGENVSTMVKPNYITVNGGFFVFERAENARDYSGTYIRNFLESRGHQVIYSNYYPSSFKGFDAIFISFGNYGSGFTIMDDEMALAMTDYLMDGGKVYFESASTLGYFQNSNTTLLNLFGLAAASPVGNNPIDGLMGLEGALTEGLMFSSSSQTAFNFIEQYVPDVSEGSLSAFSESNYGNVAVQNEGDVYNQKTFCFAYSLAELNDDSPEMSRNNFMVRLMDFFGFPEEENFVIASFDSDFTSVLPNEEILFKDLSFSAEGTSIDSWEWDFDMDGEIDSYEQHPTFSYQKGGIYDVMLVASNGIVSDTAIYKSYVAVRSGILVYDGKNDVGGYSGAFIAEYLNNKGYQEVGYTNVFPEKLTDYDVVFLSFGNAGNQKTEVTADMANIIESYGLSGGRIYIDGGDAMTEGKQFWTTFGLADAENGSNHMLQQIDGQDGSVADGLIFTGSDQFSNYSIDQYSKINDIPVIKNVFVEGDYGSVAVEFDGTELFGQKTVCMSYCLAELQDGDGQNTRYKLLERILNFFDVVASVDENNDVSSLIGLKVFPNPSTDLVTLQINTEEAGPADIILYDLSGRSILVSPVSTEKGVQTFTYNIQNLPDGLYYFNIRTEKHTESVKWLKVN